MVDRSGHDPKQSDETENKVVKQKTKNIVCYEFGTKQERRLETCMSVCMTDRLSVLFLVCSNLMIITLLVLTYVVVVDVVVVVVVWNRKQ